MGDQPSRIGFQVQANGVHYHLIDLKLKPHETRAIDLRKLRDAQTPDFKKNKIPGGATDGSVSWIRLDNVPVMGRLVVLERRGGVASSYDYCPCPCPPNFSSVSVSPPSIVGLPGDTTQCAATGHYTDCNFLDWPEDIRLNANWSSNNIVVATVNSTGFATAAACGTANIIATFTDVTYPFAPSGFCSPVSRVTKSGSTPCDVQCPSSLSVISVGILPTGTSGDYGCTPGIDFGIKVKVTYQVLDQKSPPTAINRSDMEPQETVTNVVLNGVSQPDAVPNWADIGPSRISGTSQFTNSSGQFIDAPYGACGTGAFSFSFTQRISIPVKGTRYIVRTNNVSVSSSSQSRGSITNGADINTSR